MMKIALTVIFCFFSMIIYGQDGLYYNGNIYTADSAFSKITAFAVKNGRIIETGGAELREKFGNLPQTDLGGKAVYPGFYDAHCHFYGYSIDLKKIWLAGTTSYSEILDTLVKRKDDLFMGWLFGRGWDQNDWEIKEYPDKSELDSLFPDIPVFLMRIDGHAALVNQKALDIAGITASTKVDGGEIMKRNGRLTGLLIDNAVDLVKNKVPEPSEEVKTKLLLQGQKNCFSVGLTSVADAGLEKDDILLIEKLQNKTLLKIRMYAMAMFSKKNAEYFFKRGKFNTGRLHVNSFKIYSDGALGSRGAALLEPYSDQPHHHGFLLDEADSIEWIANEVAKHDFQLNVHAIGDSANRLILNIYKSIRDINKRRWRIEHAQVLSPDDISLFGKYGIIPSVQPTHATSDMYWAEERIAGRVKSSYAYKTLLKQNGMIACGSDFPVESINPLYGFYAAVARKDRNGYPPERFYPEEALTRTEALKGMTIWAAYACFEEKDKGSIEKGKFADFVILDDDIMQCSEDKIHKVKVIATYIGGEKVYGN